jgi:hypothetical protein
MIYANVKIHKQMQSLTAVYAWMTANGTETMPQMPRV